MEHCLARQDTGGGASLEWPYLRDAAVIHPPRPRTMTAERPTQAVRVDIERPRCRCSITQRGL